jgi:hypothetical protein
MKGDFTRFTHNPAKHYSGVLKQQGRVDVDADWNEYVQIRDYLGRTETRDVIGRCGVPKNRDGSFKVVRLDDKHTIQVQSGKALPGRIYVDGILCEIDQEKILENPTHNGVYLAYLDVWQAHITAVEDPDLPEIALGGPDTTTRIKTQWQARLEDVTESVGAGPLDCKPFCCRDADWPEGARSTGKLAAHAKVDESAPKICEVPAEAGYRGLQNRLYRVEVHADSATGKPTFKWSRDNGSVVFPIKVEKIEGSVSTGYKSYITLKQLGKDEILTLHINDWVEVLGDKTELDGKPGTMAQVASELEGTNLAKGIVVLKVDLSKHQNEKHLKIRRWDQQETSSTSLVKGAIPITEGIYQPLENGVEVCFTAGGIYHTGDYWTIPARTIIRDVLWPKEADGQTPQSLPKEGIEHHYCALALIIFKDGIWSDPHDCRHIFPPLTEIESGGCCITVHEGESVQQAVDTTIAAGGGCICLCDGIHRIEGPLVIRNATNLTMCGGNEATEVHFEGPTSEGDGGILLYGCSNVAIKNMVILGDAMPALISTKMEDGSGLNRNISFCDLTIFNRTQSSETKRNICAMYLANTKGVDIENCRLIAETGIVSLFGDKLPEPPTPSAEVGFFLIPAYAKETAEVLMVMKGVGLQENVEIRIGDKVVESKVISKEKNAKVAFVVPADTASGDYLVTARDRSGKVIGSATLTVGDSSPSPAATIDYGIGVHDLCMKGVRILYRRYGVWSLKSVGWHLTDCEISPAAREWVVPETGGESHRVSGHILESALSDGGAKSYSTGTAIKALIWADSSIEGCSLSGMRGMEVWYWLRGHASGNNISGVNGMGAVWLHDARWSDNRIECNGGFGLEIGGSYRACIKDNQVRGAGRALLNGEMADFAIGLYRTLSEIVIAYGMSGKAGSGTITLAEDPEHFKWMALWMLMEEACRHLGLAELRDRVQDLIDTFDSFQQMPVLLLASAQLYPKLAEISRSKRRGPMPIIDLKVEGNDFEATESVILLQNFIPMGGMRIIGNRVHTLSGQAILVKASSITVNPHAITLGWRLVFKRLPAIWKGLYTLIRRAQIPLEQKMPLGNIILTLDELLLRWGKQSESMLETDYRIENNNVRSRQTAIESNLFELAIKNNYITLQESPLSNDDLAGIIGILNQSETTKGLAVGMGQRSKARIDAYTRTVNFQGDTPAAMKARRELTEFSCRLGSTAADPKLRIQMGALNKALSESGTATIQESLGEIEKTLGSYVDSCGIWIKGAGCRIIDNHVIVPMDADQKTWAQGGIRFWDDEGTPIWLLVFFEQLLEIYKPDIEIPSLLGVTETLIDNNEIIRGIGHGVEIRGIANMPGMGLSDLKIRGNQIRDMAGAGVMFHEESLSIGVDIEGNHVADCGSKSLLDAFAAQKGGLVIRNVAFCRIHENRIGCKSNLQEKLGLFGIDLRTVYNLQITNNTVQHREVSGFSFGESMVGEKRMLLENHIAGYSLVDLCGAVKLSEVQGEVGIQNNDLLLVQGSGVGLVLGDFATGDNGRAWLRRVVGIAQNISRKTASTMPADNVPDTTPGSAAAQAQVINAGIQGNHFESLFGQPFFAFLISKLKDLNFSGNNVRMNTPAAAPGIIREVDRGVISNNILDTLEVNAITSGVLAANACNEAIAPIPPGMVNGLNTP